MLTRGPRSGPDGILKHFGLIAGRVDMATIRGRFNGMRLVLALSGVLLAGSNSTVAMAAWTVTLVNQTGQNLTFYEVNANPTPSRLPAGSVPDGASFAIDPDGYNPAFSWDAGISKTGTDPNGFYIQLNLTDIPPLILYRLCHFKVPPGTEGQNAALQPILLGDKVFTVTKDAVVIVADGTWGAKLAPPSVAGACCAPGGVCSNVNYAGVCKNGVFLPGISCGLGVCGTGTGTVGTGGGTVTSSDGNASITFPKNCLTSDKKITIKKANWPANFSAIVLQYGQSVKTSMSYTFEPHTLEFCPGAQLCISMNLSDHGLGTAACGELKILHKDQVCVHGAPSVSGKQCSSDADCGAGGKCGLRWSPHPTKCTCTNQAGQLIARCCTNPEHFSDFGLVTMTMTMPFIDLILWPIIVFLILVLIGGTIYVARRRVANA